MMLVVAVALSTATYAWFTQNASVTANSITMTAGTSDTSALGIAWATTSGTAGTPAWNAGYGTDITAKAPATAQTNGFQPAAPKALTGIANNAAPTFYTAYIDAQGNFKAAGTETDVYRYTEDAVSNASNLIHIANLAQSGVKSVDLTATITDLSSDEIDVTPLIRIAAYVVSGETPAYTYKGTLGASAGSNNTAVGEITGPTTVEQVTTQQTANSLKTGSTATTVSLGNIEAQHEITVAIFVWLDGAAFDEAYSTQQASIALTFTAANAVA